LALLLEQPAPPCIAEIRDTTVPWGDAVPGVAPAPQRESPRRSHVAQLHVHRFNARRARMSRTPRLPPGEFRPVVELEDVHFDFDKYDIRPGDAKILDPNARWMKANPGI